MWLMLCESNDLSALWAYQCLKGYGIEPLELITAQKLGSSLRWVHHLNSYHTSVEITLINGKKIYSSEIRGVINRLRFVPVGHLAFVHPTEREYALQELNAFYLSWLYALPLPVLNRPNPYGLSGQWREESEWIWMASQAGLPTPDYHLSCIDHIEALNSGNRITSFDEIKKTVFVVAGHVIDPHAPTHILNGCQRLATLVNTELLGIEFTIDSSGSWTFMNATPWPDLRLGGEKLLNALSTVLKSHYGSSL